MSEPTGEFRERLLDAQRTTPALREEYRRELDKLLHVQLTPQSRWLTVGGIVVSLGFAIACIASLIVHHAKPGVWFLLPAYSAIFLLAALALILALRRGGFARRSAFTVVEQLGGAMVGIYVTVALFRGMRAPADPVSIYWTVWAVLFAMVGFAWGTGNRIAAATLETREHLLRIESRLADLAERTSK